MRGDAAFQRLVDHYTFDTVLDVGSGAGEQARAFRARGKAVTEVDIGRSVYWRRRSRRPQRAEIVVGDVMGYQPAEPFDCVWASHVLEHQRNPGAFLDRLVALTRPGGVLAVTVPPRKDQIVGGHVTLWNAGLLFYHLILAGLDCRGAELIVEGYDISAIVTVRPLPDGALDSLEHDSGDIDRLAEWFPFEAREGFDGAAVDLARAAT